MLISLVSLCLSAAGAPAQFSAPVTPVAGMKAPAFTVKDFHGKTIHFPGDYKGKLVMLDFWATWCDACIGDMPLLVKIYKIAHPKGFEVLGMTQERKSTVKALRPIMKVLGVNWDQVLDGPKFVEARKYNIRFIPDAFLVDGSTE